MLNKYFKEYGTTRARQGLYASRSYQLSWIAHGFKGEYDVTKFLGKLGD